MTGTEMRRALARMAHEIIERNHGPHDLVVAGIPTRGIPIAVRIADFIERFESVRPQVMELDPSPFRDDTHRIAGNWNHAITRPDSMSDVDVSGLRVVIVDDVFYTGRTTRAAMDALMYVARPSYVHLAVLINRGHRELPINPDFVGRNVPTSRAERVYVWLEEVDGIDKVAISRFDAAAADEKTVSA